MNVHDATEQAYKNGYAKGWQDAMNETWHDLSKNPDDLPDDGSIVMCEVYGSDIIVCRKDETLAEAFERIQQEHYTTVGSYDKDDGWTDYMGYPMIVMPKYWKEIKGYDAP